MRKHNHVIRNSRWPVYVDSLLIWRWLFSVRWGVFGLNPMVNSEDTVPCIVFVFAVESTVEKIGSSLRLLSILQCVQGLCSSYSVWANVSTLLRIWNTFVSGNPFFVDMEHHFCVTMWNTFFMCMEQFLCVCVELLPGVQGTPSLCILWNAFFVYIMEYLLCVHGAPILCIIWTLSLCIWNAFFVYIEHLCVEGTPFMH